MGGERKTVILITEDGDEAWPEMAKDEVARRRAKRIGETIRGPSLVKAANR